MDSNFRERISLTRKVAFRMGESTRYQIIWMLYLYVFIGKIFSIRTVVYVCQVPIK